MLRQYACAVAWDEERETINLVAVQHKSSGQRAKPQVESAVYVKALSDPELRSKVIAALFADDKARVKAATEAGFEAHVK